MRIVSENERKLFVKMVKTACTCPVESREDNSISEKNQIFVVAFTLQTVFSGTSENETSRFVNLALFNFSGSCRGKSNLVEKVFQFS